MVVKWDKFEGAIQGDGCSATMELMFNGPLSEPSPYWFVRMNDTGMQISKNFEAGKLEQAYRWCVETIQDHERQSKERGNS